MEKPPAKWADRVDPYFTQKIKSLSVGTRAAKNTIDRYANIGLPLIGFLLQSLPKETDQIKLAIEGYSMGSANKGLIFNIAEHTGLFKYMLSSAGYTYKEVAPTTLKKFATDSGRADKTQMMNAFQKEFGRDFIPAQKTIGNPYSDIVDSYYLAKFMIE